MNCAESTRSKTVRGWGTEAEQNTIAMTTINHSSNLNSDSLSCDRGGAGPSAAYLAAYVQDLVWNLGRSLLLLWLHSVRSLEPFFITAPIRGPSLLAIELANALHRHGHRLAGVFDQTRRICRLLALDADITTAELFSSGLSIIDEAGLLDGVDHRRRARYLHLRAFVLRMHDDSRYEDHMALFGRRVRAAKRDVRREYECRWSYERGSFLSFSKTLYSPSEALPLFRRALEVAESLGRNGETDTVEHLIFGAHRNIIVLLLKEHRDDEALEAWNSLRRRFDARAIRHALHDCQLMLALRAGGERSPGLRQAFRCEWEVVQDALDRSDLPPEVVVLLRRIEDDEWKSLVPDWLGKRASPSVVMVRG